MQSMTGYGKAEISDFRIDIRSLNHKSLEINIKLPAELLYLDAEIRGLVRQSFSRGRFDITVSKLAKTNQLSVSAIENLYKELLDISLRFNLLSKPSLSDIASFMGFLAPQALTVDKEQFLQAVKTALDALKAMRQTEGEALCREIKAYLDLAIEAVEKIKSSSLQCLVSFKDKLKDKITNLASGVVDEARLAQEIAIIAQRADISEELDRLLSHIKQIETLLKSTDANGKKLDFLLQEMHREANTIASKATQTDIVNLTVDLRVLIEKMREQAQNIQ